MKHMLRNVFVPTIQNNTLLYISQTAKYIRLKYSLYTVLIIYKSQYTLCIFNIHIYIQHKICKFTVVQILKINYDN